MSFQPVVPSAGLAGWAFLSSTREAQESAFQSGAALTRDTDYFQERIGEIRTAEDLVSDRRLLRVALGAFGLDSDIDSRFFVRKVLEEGTTDDQALANRLSDKRYQAMSEAFGFDLSPPNTVLSTFGPGIVESYRTRQFEVAVGNTSPDMRLALSIEREVQTIAERGLTGAAAWFTVMATPPLRAVVEQALSIPSSVGALDVDQQLEIFRGKAAAVFGSADFEGLATDEGIDTLRTRFLAQSDLTGTPSGSTRGSVALALLQGSQAPFAGGLLP